MENEGSTLKIIDLMKYFYIIELQQRWGTLINVENLKKENYHCKRQLVPHKNLDEQNDEEKRPQKMKKCEEDYLRRISMRVRVGGESMDSGSLVERSEDSAERDLLQRRVSLIDSHSESLPSRIAPNLSAITPNRFLSTHRPILLRESTHDYGPIPFRFFHYWLKMEGFENFVNEVWREAPDIKAIHWRSKGKKVADSRVGIQVHIGEANSFREVGNIEKIKDILGFIALEVKKLTKWLLKLVTVELDAGLFPRVLKRSGTMISFTCIDDDYVKDFVLVSTPEIALV
ncbi:hypothetical protein Tco_1503026 [Tanacetum coccineum]